jgi:hypothetical protein
MFESGRGRKRPGGKRIENRNEKLKAFGNALILDGRFPVRAAELSPPKAGSVSRVQYFRTSPPVFVRVADSST